MARIRKVISGAQTGADRGGLIAAQIRRVPTGGYVVKGCLSEDGLREDLIPIFGLTELETGGYPVRTAKNAQGADFTVIISTDESSRGTVLTIQQSKGKYALINPDDYETPEAAAADTHLPDSAEVLNVAGNRESVSPGIQRWTIRYVTSLLARHPK